MWVVGVHPATPYLALDVAQPATGIPPLKIYVALCVYVILVLGSFALGTPVSEDSLLVVLLVTVVISWMAPRFGK